MKCPHCERTIEAPLGKDMKVSGVDTVILICPSCQAILGAVAKPLPRREGFKI